MHEGETIKQPQDRIEELEHENELLKAKISELEARLAQYENTHTQPSLRRGGNRKIDQDKKSNGTSKWKSQWTDVPIAGQSLVLLLELIPR